MSHLERFEELKNKLRDAQYALADHRADFKLMREGFDQWGATGRDLERNVCRLEADVSSAWRDVLIEQQRRDEDNRKIYDERNAKRDAEYDAHIARIRQVNDEILANQKQMLDRVCKIVEAQ